MKRLIKFDDLKNELSSYQLDCLFRAVNDCINPVSVKEFGVDLMMSLDKLHSLNKISFSVWDVDIDIDNIYMSLIKYCPPVNF